MKDSNDAGAVEQIRRALDRHSGSVERASLDVRVSATTLLKWLRTLPALAGLLGCAPQWAPRDVHFHVSGMTPEQVQTLESAAKAWATVYPYKVTFDGPAQGYDQIYVGESDPHTLGWTYTGTFKIGFKRELLVEPRFYRVAVHEFGHALFDLPDSPDRASIMGNVDSVNAPTDADLLAAWGKIEEQL